MKKTTNILLIILITVLSVLTVQGQEDVPQKYEVGMSVRNLNDFDFILKKHRQDNKYLRFSAGRLNANWRSSPWSIYQTGRTDRRNSIDASISLSLAWEYRKKIGEQLWFVHGFEPGFSFSIYTAGFNEITSTRYRIDPQLGYILGLQYDISEQFYVGAEVLPTISASLQIDNFAGLNTNQIFGRQSYLQINSTKLNFVYRFSK